MVQQTPAKIFLAEQRGQLESPQFRRRCTFAFGEYADEHKQPFGALRAFNEETLAGGHTVTLPPAAQAAQVLVLPITGAVRVQLAGEPALVVEVEQLHLLSVPAGQPVRFTNPHEAELISFLHIWLAAPAAGVGRLGQNQPLNQTSLNQTFDFDLAAAADQLVPVLPAPDPGGGARPPETSLRQVGLGRFAGRAEAVYAPLPPAGRVFVFVLAGAFEVAGRLLHERDGLALWDTAEIDLEALSNGAVILLLDLAD